MHTGTIKKLVRDRGFGFITDTDSREVFFHQSSMIGTSFDALQGDEKVEFEIEQSPKGPRAVNIQVVSS